jgi:hypothetical protein
MRFPHFRSLVPGIVIAMGLLPAGCTHSPTSPHDTIVGSGKMISEQRDVGAFEGIQVTGYADVVITQGSLEALRVEADDNILPRVQTSVQNGTLVVALEEGSYSKITVNVYVSMKTIERLECTGAADFTVTGPVSLNDFVCRITGTGHVTLTGSAVTQTVLISGSGTVHNFGLVTSRTTVQISGAGTVEVHALEELSAVISGAGNIVYAGDPPVVHQTVSGVGSIGRKP